MPNLSFASTLSEDGGNPGTVGDDACRAIDSARAESTH